MSQHQWCRCFKRPSLQTWWHNSIIPLNLLLPLSCTFSNVPHLLFNSDHLIFRARLLTFNKLNFLSTGTSMWSSDSYFFNVFPAGGESCETSLRGWKLHIRLNLTNSEDVTSRWTSARWQTAHSIKETEISCTVETNFRTWLDLQDLRLETWAGQFAQQRLCSPVTRRKS